MMRGNYFADKLEQLATFGIKTLLDIEMFRSSRYAVDAFARLSDDQIESLAALLNAPDYKIFERRFYDIQRRHDQVIHPISYDLKLIQDHLNDNSVGGLLASEAAQKFYNIAIQPYVEKRDEEINEARDHMIIGLRLNEAEDWLELIEKYVAQHSEVKS